MRRFILVFMMLLLPLQWSWAAAASVCAHEAAGAHFGHHAHKHAGDAASTAADEGSQSEGGLAGNHPDCHACHGMGAASIGALLPHERLWNDGSLAAVYARAFPEPPVHGLLRPPMNSRRLIG